MKPDRLAGIPASTAGGVAQKVAKTSGLTDSPDLTGFGGFLALLSAQEGELPNNSPALASMTADATAGSLSTFASPNDQYTADVGSLPVDGPVPPADVTFLLSQNGAVLPFNLPETVQSQSPASSASVPSLLQDSVAALSIGTERPEPGSASDTENTKSPDNLDAEFSRLASIQPEPRPNMVTSGSGGNSGGLTPRSELSAVLTGQIEQRVEKTGNDLSKAVPETGVKSRTEDMRFFQVAARGRDTLGSHLPILESMPALVAANGDLRPVERQVIKPLVTARTSFEGVFGSQPGVFGERTVPAVTVPGLGALQPELQIAEQVSLWVSRDIQNADLRLRGFDDLPIDVHISMQGKDAQVDFRTDHAEIRDILRSAESHLKDMLARDGVVLSGVSVGTSGRDEGGQEGRQQPNLARRQAVNLDEPSDSGVMSRSVSRSGGAIDVFV